MTHEVQGERLLLWTAPLALFLELFDSKHAKAHDIYNKTAKVLLVVYLCMTLPQYIEQIYIQT